MIATEESQAKEQTGYLNEWSRHCSLMVLKIGGHDQSVCNLTPNILRQAVNNLEATSESDKLTNSRAGCHVRKSRET